MDPSENISTRFGTFALTQHRQRKIKRHELALQFAKGELRTGSKGAAAGPLAVALQAIWSALLSADHVGVNDDFLMLGGDSLTGARLLAQVREVFGVALALDALLPRMRNRQRHNA